MCGQDLREEVGGSNFVGFSAQAGRLETPGFPGCLTSESEERETWTAESLRAAFREGAILQEGGRTRHRRYTFLGTTPCRLGEQSCRRLHVGPRQCEGSGTKKKFDVSLRAKRVISRDQNLIQLESLILAQSERWRQA